MTVTPSTIEQRSAGHLGDGREVIEYTLRCGAMELSAITYGGIVTRLLAPDRHGVRGNVVLGFDNLPDYLHRNPNFGITVGRYGNRIAGGSFDLDGKTHTLPRNDGSNCLHGGPVGFGKRLWAAQPQPVASDGSVALVLRYTSPDGEEGFPGTLQVQVTYTLTPDTWRIDYQATTDAATVLNLTHHDYFNLAGHGTALGHRLQLPASRFLAVDERLIPQSIEAVQGTPFDFTQGAAIAPRIRSPHPQLGPGKGFDHCWLLDGPPDASGLRTAAVLSDSSSGRRLQVLSTEPAVQFYSGNFLDGRLVGSGGERYRAGDGLCLETQHSPDSPHHDSSHPDWPSTVLRPGQVFSSRTLHRFSVEG